MWLPILSLSQAHLSCYDTDLQNLSLTHVRSLTQSIRPLPFGLYCFGHFKARTSRKAPTSNEEHEGSVSFMCLCTAKHRWASKCLSLVSVCLCQNDASSSAIWTQASVSLPSNEGTRSSFDVKWHARGCVFVGVKESTVSLSFPSCSHNPPSAMQGKQCVGLSSFSLSPSVTFYILLFP